MSAREEILKTLRRGAFTSPLHAPFIRTGGAELTARFVERASAAGAEVQLVEHEALPAAVSRAVADGRARRIVAHGDLGLAPVVAALRAGGVAVLLPDEQTREAVAEAEVGLTAADYGIAETGTLVLATGAGRPRLVSLLPGRHIAVLPEERIYGTIFDLLSRVQDVPSALACITGPSRTADIELTPVRGAHGPVAVTIFVVRGAMTARSP